MELIVLGGNSGIFKFLAPELAKHFDKIFIGTRSEPVIEINGAVNFKLDFTNDSLGTVFSEINKPILVLNFLGYFGKLKNFFEYLPSEIMENLELNLVPFFVIHQSARCLPSNSLIINFSGSGVGGENLEISNFAYASSKILTSNLIESLDKMLMTYNVKTCAISPGPFPTNMQLEILKHKSLETDPALILKTEKIFENKVDVSELINLILFLNANRQVASGRVWSAKWDKSFDNYTETIGHHGHFRRLTI
jgi:NAD(P)-dependent dehydrogenase (short-subunit alcohol dehydrogenase family)